MPGALRSLNRARERGEYTVCSACIVHDVLFQCPQSSDDAKQRRAQRASAAAARSEEVATRRVATKKAAAEAEAVAMQRAVQRRAEKKEVRSVTCDTIGTAPPPRRAVMLLLTVWGSDYGVGAFGRRRGMARWRRNSHRACATSRQGAARSARRRSGSY